MSLSCYKMYSATAATAATSEGIATMDIPEDGEITSIAWSIVASDATAASGRAELSFTSSQGLTTNDTRAAIASVAYACTNGLVAAVNFEVRLDPPVKISGGDRIYFHNINQTAFDVLQIVCHIYSSTKGVARARRI